MQNIDAGTGSCEVTPSTMSRVLQYCPRGCRSAFIHRLTTLFNAEKTGASTFYCLDRPYDRVAHVMNMTVGAVHQIIRRSQTSSR